MVFHASSFKVSYHIVKLATQNVCMHSYKTKWNTFYITAKIMQVQMGVVHELRNAFFTVF